MSKETLNWLNTNTLIGCTDKRGNAWHYRANEQGGEPNHYGGFVPVPDVKRRLFGWTAIELPVIVPVPCTIDDADSMNAAGEPVRYVTVANRKAVARSDNYSVMGIFADGYEGHQYETWLLDNVANLISDELGIGSAGLLKGGARAWVQLEMPESISTTQGVAFRPNLLATTSFDGSLATTYKRTVGVVVCDNTLECGLNESGETFKVRHTRNSQLRIADARQALAIVEQTADDFTTELDRLCSWEVTPAQWARLLDKIVPIPGTESKRAATLAERKRSDLEALYVADARCAPWTGTAFGALQAFNTYNTHVATFRGGDRAERNMNEIVMGRMAAADDRMLAALATC